MTCHDLAMTSPPGPRHDSRSATRSGASAAIWRCPLRGRWEVELLGAAAAAGPTQLPRVRGRPDQVEVQRASPTMPKAMTRARPKARPKATEGTAEGEEGWVSGMSAAEAKFDSAPRSRLCGAPPGGELPERSFLAWSTRTRSSSKSLGWPTGTEGGCPLRSPTSDVTPDYRCLHDVRARQTAACSLRCGCSQRPESVGVYLEELRSRPRVAARGASGARWRSGAKGRVHPLLTIPDGHHKSAATSAPRTSGAHGRSWRGAVAEEVGAGGGGVESSMAPMLVDACAARW